ncbi:MAG: hypothetical protein HF978_08445 [Desulfobacteraceae bacterium]|nr:hypothetical protein [Desulfobacteraceae bacterium]MBC2755560.1 hypothetical protein [Desulfobacteraceae bacterium]
MNKNFIKGNFLITLLGILLLNTAYAQNISNIIDTDTVWKTENSPYELQGVVQVAEGARLTIEPGFKVVGNSSDYIKFFMGAELIAIGDEKNNIIFENVRISGATGIPPNDGKIQLEHCILKGGGVLHDEGTRTVIVRNSKIYNYSLYIGCCEAEGIIKNNIFVQSDHIILNSTTNYTIENNVFINPNKHGAIFDHSIVPNYRHILQYNSFLSSDQIAVKSCEEAKNNYWGTSNTETIEEMIYDKKDDLDIHLYTEYEPYLTMPHAETPIIEVVADAGGNLTASEGEIVTLNGFKSHSNIEIEEFHWVQTSGPDITLTDAKALSPSFWAPDVGPDGESLSFKITITTIGGISDSASCSVNVIWINQPPSADAGPDQIVNEGDIVTLDAGASNDNDDGVAQYQWTQINGPSVVLSGDTKVKPEFIAPLVDDQETLTFQLSIEDNGGLIHSDDVIITINNINENSSNNDDNNKESDSGGGSGGGGCFILSIF